MRFTQSILTLALTFCAASLAYAAPMSFKKADANGDGSVDATEFAASGVTKKLASLDKNGDGMLDKKEYSAALDEDCE